MSLKFCFVVPCYNEAKNIPNLINELKKINNDHDDIHFVLVDNGSTDTSQELVKTESKDLNFTPLGTDDAICAKTLKFITLFELIDLLSSKEVVILRKSLLYFSCVT